MYISSEFGKKPDYIPGLERWSNYKTIWTRHWIDFVKIYPSRFEEVYGKLDDDKKEEVRKLIRCGKFQNGFKRHTCPNCGIVLIVPFTCKSRLCLSCYRKKLFGWSLNLSHIMNTSLTHTHVTFTIPGTISNILFNRKFEPEKMIPLAANIFRNMLISSAGLKGKEFQPGICATLHKSGNSLNFNPHVHLVGTQELIDTTTGEILEVPFLPYRKIRFIWKQVFLNSIKKAGFITEKEYADFDVKYSNGFHVYFQPIVGSHNDILFRTAEYIASGYFHNSQITEVNHSKLTVTFRYKKWVDRGTKQKHFSTMTMDIYSFMARMLFFLPAKHLKLIRYYGIYSRDIEKKLKEIDRKTWALAIRNSFDKAPEECPECSLFMIQETVFSFLADREIRKLIKTHAIIKGYFIPHKKENRKSIPP